MRRDVDRALWLPHPRLPSDFRRRLPDLRDETPRPLQLRLRRADRLAPLPSQPEAFPLPHRELTFGNSHVETRHAASQGCDISLSIPSTGSGPISSTASWNFCMLKSDACAF